jgi:transposase-like protein
VTERSDRTAQGYRRFRCRTCGKQFNERAGTLRNRAQYPSDVIALVVLWRLRYKFSLRDLPEMFLIRGIVFSHEAVRDWEAKLTPALAEGLRRHRRGKVGRGWFVDETYIKVNGHWRYLYRAIDRNGALVDVMFSEHRDMAVAKAIFRSAKTVTGLTPQRSPSTVTTAIPVRSARRWARACSTAPAAISTTDWSRITAASRGATNRCAGSSARTLPGGSVEATTNSVTSSVPASVPIIMFPPITAGFDAYAAPRPL